MRTITYSASALALLMLAAPAAADTVPFVDTTPGPTTFTAPETGVYDILAFGGQDRLSRRIAGARVDGEGLNPLLQNYWMVIHPPSLYTGFVGCTIPFSSYAPEALSSLVSGMPNRITPPMPSACVASHSLTSSSIES